MMWIKKSAWVIYLGISLGFNEIHARMWQFWVIFIPVILLEYWKTATTSKT